MKRTILALFVLCLALFPTVPHVSAGGWAAVAFVEPLPVVTTGQEVTVEFRVLAHNRPEAPVTGMRTTFLFTDTETGYFVVAEGEATADPEVYAISFILASPGEWDLRAMIHNYRTDGPILWTSPDAVSVSPAT